MSEEKEQSTSIWKKNGIVLVVPSAVIASLVSGGLVVFWNPLNDADALRSIARPDPFTGAEHRQYAETVDVRFNACMLAIANLQKREEIHSSSDHPPSTFLDSLAARFRAWEIRQQYMEKQMDEMRAEIKRINDMAQYRGTGT